jgi:predicted transcriptional regulator
MNTKLTKFELEVMRVLWDCGTASIRDLLSHLPERSRPAYTTVQTIVYRLEKKGAVRRTGKAGNAHVFEPVIKRQAAHRRLVDDLLKLFGGSARPLMTHLAESGQLSLDDLREAEDVLTHSGGGGKVTGERAARAKRSGHRDRGPRK